MAEDPAQHEDIRDGETVWRFDRRFLTSRWTCTWGRGCKGIEAEPAPELALGCCSVGAQLDGPEEAMLVSAMAAMIPPELFEHGEAAADGGIFADDARSSTRVVDGACVFLNRPGHPGGAGCALHLAAVAAGDPPLEWKPSVCWQLPVKVDWAEGSDGVEVATVRAWRRDDWGDDEATMGWFCTDAPENQVGDRPVVESLGEELAAIVGEPVYVELRRRLAGPPPA